MQLVKPSTNVFPFKIKPGYIILKEFSILGGSHVSQTVSEDQSSVVTELKYDNVEIVKTAKSIDRAARFKLNSICAYTPLGHYTDDEGWGIINEAIEPLCKEAEALSKLSEAAGSDLRMTLGIYRFDLKADNEPVTRRLKRYALEEFQTFKQRIERAAITDLDNDVKLRTEKISMFCTGIYAEVAARAAKSYREQRSKLLLYRKNVNRGLKVDSDFDLTVVDDAIALFGEG